MEQKRNPIGSAAKTAMRAFTVAELLVTIAVIAIITLFCVGKLTPAFFKRVNYSGVLYVKLNSGNTLPLGMVNVAMYDEDSFRNAIVKINNTLIDSGKKSLPAQITDYNNKKKELEDSLYQLNSIDAQRKKLEDKKSDVTYWWKKYQEDKTDTYSLEKYQKALAVYQNDSSQTQPFLTADETQSQSDEIRKKLDALSESEPIKIVEGARDYLVDNLIHNNAVATVQTSADGHFHFTFPHKGNYLLIAMTTRPGVDEAYVFMRQLRFPNAGDYTEEINNNNDMVSEMEGNRREMDRKAGVDSTGILPPVTQREALNWALWSWYDLDIKAFDDLKRQKNQ